MLTVKIYGSATCPFTRAARRLLDTKGVAYEFYSVDNAPEVRREMEERAGRHTVPQIFIGDRHIGGFDDLAEMEADDRLDELVT